MAFKKNFIDKTITETLRFMKESVFADEIASRKGFFQVLDPRIKIITLFFVLVSMQFVSRIEPILFAYFFVLVLAKASGIGLGFFLKRTWIFIPFFSLVIAIPALFEGVSPGEPIVFLDFYFWKAAITRQGFRAAALFVGRVSTSVSIVILLSLTTRHFVLLKALRSFGVPDVFVMTLNICYRYIYLFLDVVEKVHLALKSRVGRVVGHRGGRRLAAWNIASLWHKSYCLNESVYQAMVSRGYRGRPLVWCDFKTRALDWFWLVFCAAFCALLLKWGGAV